MADDVLIQLTRLGEQAQADAVRLSAEADRLDDESSRRRAVEAWRVFTTRWDAIRSYRDARSARRAGRLGSSQDGGADWLASGRPRLHGRVDRGPSTRHGIGPTADNDVVLLQDHLAADPCLPVEQRLEAQARRDV